MTLGDYIAARRRALHLTAPMLAERAGVPVQYIRNVENQRVKSFPPPDRLRALAAALGVTPRDLLIAAGYIDE